VAVGRLWTSPLPDGPSGGSDDRPGEQGSRHQRRRPGDQEVLRSKPARDRPGHQAADHPSHDEAGAVQGEEPLGLAGVVNGPGQGPHGEELNGPDDHHGQPHDRVDPPTGQQHQSPKAHDHAGHDQRSQDHERSPTRTGHQRVQGDHDAEGHDPDGDVEIGEEVRSEPHEEERLDGVRANGRPDPQHDRQEQEAKSDAPLAGPDLQGALQSHRSTGLRVPGPRPAPWSWPGPPPKPPGRPPPPSPSVRSPEDPASRSAEAARARPLLP
jgi:hypothetical protein